jgi:hypothetical protein
LRDVPVLFGQLADMEPATAEEEQAGNEQAEGGKTGA